MTQQEKKENLIDLTVDQYAEIKVGMKETAMSIDNLKTGLSQVEDKVDDLADNIKKHMDAEEKTKKKIMWLMVSIAVGIILNAMGVPVADFLGVFKAIGG